jgi:L,D-transpeptidase ErfK/SrfK
MSFRRVLVFCTVRMMKILSTVAAMALLATMILPTEAPARSFPLEKGQDAVGDIGQYTTKYEDTLLDIARANDLGYTQLIIANRGIDPWLPGKDVKVVLPQFYILPAGPRRGIVINLIEQRVFYFQPGGHAVETFPIGVGVQGRTTPTGTTRIAGKQVHPGWTVPASIRAEKPELPAYVPPGPDNPLGDYAMPLAWNGYLMHGTDKPYGVGRNVSHGCIRLYPEDIEHLFHEVAIGTPVRVIDEEVEAAWSDNQLYVAVFPDKDQTDQIDIEEPMTKLLPADLIERVTAVAGNAANRVDWDLVKRLGMERSGIPTRVTDIAIATSASMSEAPSAPATAAEAPTTGAASSMSQPAEREERSDLPAAETSSDTAAPADEALDLPATMVAAPATSAPASAKAESNQDNHSAEDAATINRVLNSFPAK